MTTQQLYQKVINEQMTKNEFLWNVRRDDRFTSIVTNTMSFEDTISVLKGKGHVWENSQEAPAVRPFDFIGSMRSLSEAAKKDNKLKGGKGDKLDADHVNYHEFTKGWKHELEHTDDIDKAKEIALDHLAEDPNYYTRLDMIEYKAEKSKKKTAAKKTKEGEMVDKENQMTPLDKKKAKSNVKAGLGKQEKAKSKSAGVKVMKGGSGEMTNVNEAVDSTELLPYKVTAKSGGKSNIVKMTKAQADKLLNDKEYNTRFTIEPQDQAFKNVRKVVTTYAPGVKPNVSPEKARMDRDRATADIKGIKGHDDFAKPGYDSKGVKQIRPTSSSAKKWQVVDNSDVKNPKVIASFDDRNVAKQYSEKYPKTYVIHQLELKKFAAEKNINIKPLEEAEDVVNKDVKNVNVSFVIPGEGDQDQKLDVSDTVKSAVHNKKDNSFTVNLNGGNRVVFTPDASGKPVGVYFSMQDGKEVTKQVLDVQPPLTSILNKVYSAKKEEEPVSEALENYIRERIRQAIKEGEEGQYVGMIGPDVLKKKLKEYMTRYEWGYENSGDPAKKARGGEIHGIISKMVHELGDEGVAIFNQYAPEGYEIKTAEDLGSDPAYKVGLGPQDRDFNPEELYGRGGRVAEAAYDEEDIKRYTDVMDKDINDANLEKDMADFGEKAMTNAYGNPAAQAFVARVLGEYISRKGAQNIKNSNIIRGFHKLADKNK